MAKTSTSKKLKKKKEEPKIDFTQFTPDDIARMILETPPLVKKKEKKKK